MCTTNYIDALSRYFMSTVVRINKIISVTAQCTYKTHIRYLLLLFVRIYKSGLWKSFKLGYRQLSLFGCVQLSSLFLCVERVQANRFFFFCILYAYARASIRLHFTLYVLRYYYLFFFLFFVIVAHIAIHLGISDLIFTHCYIYSWYGYMSVLVCNSASCVLLTRVECGRLICWHETMCIQLI